ncbi:MAG: Vitamin B12 dependent methionine synthase activation subunit [Clostridia bacterium]|nr:Vitamin B12 dependent methionine synthase activation subunit [Clostridia bacterium]
MMNTVVLTETFPEPPFSKKEIIRYAGGGECDKETEKLLDEAIAEVRDALSYKVCYCELPVRVENDVCDFTAFSVNSRDLAKNLRECDGAVLFAATVGSGIDRLISKYSRISPSKALMLQAVGAERIEALCDVFCKGLKPRFSPGYGDLPLDVQEKIFGILRCDKHIGLCLSRSLIMSPSKSVTAFAGKINKRGSL